MLSANPSNADCAAAGGMVAGRIGETVGKASCTVQPHSCVEGGVMVVFMRGDEIAIGSRLPYTSDFYFCIHKKGVVKPWSQLHAEGWRVKKPILPEANL
jgi:hypothetical protein